KLDRRLNICTVMIGVCRQRQDNAGVSLWTDLMLCIDDLGMEGTSEEENDDDTVPRFRIVRDIDFRHSSFRNLFEFVDGTRDREKHVFAVSGRKRLPRSHAVDCSICAPPSKLPRSFFRPEYLSQLEKDGVYNFAQENRQIPQYDV
ncbi:hypothetical protein EV360DRAFT_58551, partial [Lentinula raphanica]